MNSDEQGRFPIGDKPAIVHDELSVPETACSNHLNRHLFPNMEGAILEFSLGGTAAGKPISARGGVPFARFMEYNAEVQQFVIGSDSRAVIQGAEVQVEEGSYKVRILIPVVAAASAVADYARIAHNPDAIWSIDKKRAEVVMKWAEHARADKGLIYTLQSPTVRAPAFQITKDTVVAKRQKDQVVDVERYIIGEITDWGGSDSVNVHVRPRNAKKPIIVTADPNQIKDQEQNLVYHWAIVHVSAKQNLRTGDVLDYRLIDLRPYSPKVDDAALDALFEKGKAAWANVPDLGAWMNEMRGAPNG